MAKYEKYAEYKDSGVEWLGEIPSHWEVSKFSYVINTVGDIDHYMPDSVDIGIPYIMTGDLQEKVSEIDLTNCKQVSQEAFQRLSKKIKTSKDDVILARYATIGTASYVDIDADFLVSYSCVTIKPKRSKTTGKYLFCYLKSDAFLQAIQMQVNSNTQGNVGVDSLRAVKVLMPPLEEQNFIINFLDHETAKIDSLIAKQEKLIELLKEKRQAVISHAVTKGLNPDVNMKDLGVEWLGQVPEHWGIPKLLHITTRIGDGLHSTPLYQEGTGYYFINGNNLVDGQILIGETAKEVPESEYIKHQVTLDDTTVLLSINGTIGKVALFNNEPVILGKSASYMNCCPELVPSFLAYYLTTSQAKNYYDLEVTGTTIYNLSLNSIRNMKVPLPPIEEQKNIVLFISEQYAKYEKLIKSSEKQNELLKERRTALISSAVTGKIDVRHHASRPTGNDKKQTEDI
ncbi:restriction endonuclease subunit S [Acinetobacter bereziniae]|uniref:restriction endonuclease subunit S n=1 Tax=Acinetobacter bereziniae TaxID=106648 RepID=UPI000EF74C4D|nr:restriction endonuclease subunit S [Acinetobacter bereziniae]